MRTVAEGQRGGTRAIDVKAVGGVEDFRVAVGGREDDKGGVALVDRDILDGLVSAGRSPDGLDGSVEAEQFGDEGGVDGGHAFERQQPDHRGTEQVGRGLVTRDGDDHRGDHDVVELEIGRGRDEAEEVVVGMRAAVGGQGQEFGQQRGKRGRALLDRARIAYVAEHPRDGG